MNNGATTDQELELTGIDGSNPLGFLAAVGTLRVLSTPDLDPAARMFWRKAVHWHPVLISSEFGNDRDALVGRLNDALKDRESATEFNAIGDDLNAPPDVFHSFAREAVGGASAKDRTTADYAAAYGSDILTTDSGDAIQDTALRTMAGAGHQHFIGFIRNIIAATQAEHIHKSLFETWHYDDPVQKLTLRFDPLDDTRYALQWRNPSGDPSRKSSGSMLGANRLAIEALPLFTTVPAGMRLETVGFRGRSSSNTYWHWPIWNAPADLDVVRSLLSHPLLHEPQDEQDQERDRRQKRRRRIQLAEMGIAEVFRSQRLTVGKVRNFTRGQPV